MIGIVLGSLYNNVNLEKPFSNEITGNTISMPKDRIQESQIKVYSDKVVIELEDAKWSKFTDTNSMVPFLDAGANAIQITPDSAEDIEIGDIISYNAQFTSGRVIHRVTEIGEDEQGLYFITQGDNNDYQDPDKIRFSDIYDIRVLVAIIY